jgi:hypothetical protein
MRAMHVQWMPTGKWRRNADHDVVIQLLPLRADRRRE